MPHNWKCWSHDSQALWLPALLWLAGLWTPCRFIWADGAGGTQERLVTLLNQGSWSWGAVLSGFTVLGNYVNEALIISNKLLKSSFLWEMSVSVLHRGVSCLSFLPPAWGITCGQDGDHPVTSRARWCQGSTAGTWGKSCSGQLQAVPWTRSWCITYRSTDSKMAIIIFWFHKEVFMWE